jgi:glutamine synthetase
MSFKSGKEVIDFAKKNNVVMVDCRITDSPGLWQHCSHPISQLEESTFQDGYGFDGSSIRGWKAINESDMLMIPDPKTAFIDPFMAHPTLVLICDVVDPLSPALHPRSRATSRSVPSSI